jgi:hypothetical protein
MWQPFQHELFSLLSKSTSNPPTRQKQFMTEGCCLGEIWVALSEGPPRRSEGWVRSDGRAVRDYVVTWQKS